MMPLRIQLIFSLALILGCTSLLAQPTEAALLGNWDRPDLVGSSAYNNTYNDVWGIALDGREYAVVGSTAGTHFIDVTDPADSQEVAFVAGEAAGPSIIHRDYHNYDCYLYAVCDEGYSSMQIIDVSYLPDSVSVVYDSDETLRQAHNIFIDTAEAKLYAFAAFGGDQFSSALRIYDITDPVDPQYIEEYDQFGEIDAGHVHDGYVQNGLGYLNCGYDGFAMVDFSDPTAPITLGTMTQYPFAGYNHSGWPSVDGQYYYLGDENHGYPMKVLDVSDPQDITAVGTLETGRPDNPQQTIPHNQIVACDYLYVSYYYDGLQVYDISDPAAPQRVSYYDTSDWPFDNNYRGAWGIYPYLPSGNVLVTDMQNGLFILEGPGDDCANREESIISCGLVNNTSSPQLTTIAVTVSPQPASSYLRLQFPEEHTTENVKARLLDLNGRAVHRFEDSWIGQKQVEWNLPQLANGLYILELQGKDWLSAQKVLIQY